MYIRNRKVVSVFTIVVGAFFLIILAAILWTTSDQDFVGLRGTGMVWGLLAILGIGYLSWIVWFFIAPRTGRARRLEEGEELLPATRKEEWRRGSRTRGSLGGRDTDAEPGRETRKGGDRRTRR